MLREYQPETPEEWSNFVVCTLAKHHWTHTEYSAELRKIKYNRDE
jgi:hypothetical protein